MRGLMLWVWERPWPGWVRRLMGTAASLPVIRVLLVPQYMVGVVALIENGQGHILLVKHTYRSDYPWGLPTGFLEHGEQPVDAIQRELHEEAGLDVRLERVWEVRSDTTRPLIDIVYRGVCLGGNFRSNLEISEARFFDPKDLPPIRPDQLRLVYDTLRGEEPHEAPA